MRTVAVITATTGRSELNQTIESVARQTYPCKHYVFFDGVQPQPLPPNVCVIPIPVKTGANGMLNGGIAAASAFIAQEDLICWCDDDNWLDANHIESLVASMGNNLWAHCLRRLVNQDGSFWDFDDGESLGAWKGFVDLNCYMMERLRLAVRVASHWYTMNADGMYVGDRAIYHAIRSIPGQSTGLYTVNYRLNSRFDLRDFFARNNAAMRQRFPGGVPWRRPETAVEPNSRVTKTDTKRP